MEIPGSLKGLTFEKIQFMGVLLGDATKGVIIADVALIDWGLGNVLASYFTGPSRRSDFSGAVIERLRFEDKICILSELSLDGSAAELQTKIVSGIRPLQKLRNVAAHSAALKPEEIERLYSDSVKRRLLDRFPDEFRKTVTEIRVWLHELDKISGFSLDA